jgi:hypothetical protein
MSSKSNNNLNEQLTLLKSNSSNFEHQQLPIKFAQYVSTCKNCLMISICDIKRLMCPFCGSFYQLNIEKEFQIIKSCKKNVMLIFILIHLLYDL